MFSKIDKKVLIWLVVAAVALVITGVFVYGQLAGTALEVQNSAGGASAENTDDGNNENSRDELQQNMPDIELDLGDVQTEGGNGAGSGGLIICFDKCGDGVCQAQDPGCPAGSLSCVCPETPEECPQDCKN